jgi:hypothetical protein
VKLILKEEEDEELESELPKLNTNPSPSIKG